MNTKNAPITSLLQLACSKPEHVVGNGGGALALALHCLMVREGFHVVDTTGAWRAEPFFYSGVVPRSVPWNLRDIRRIYRSYTTATAGQRRHSSYLPPLGWHGAYPDEWVFFYTKDGKANKFVLHCSLQASTRRMFVRANEEGNPENIQALGLQLDKYVPDPSRLRSNEWAGVLANERDLNEFFTK